MNSSNTIRSAARAIIIQNDSVLLVHMKNDDGEFFILPGGGQLHGETLIQVFRKRMYGRIRHRYFSGAIDLYS